MNRATFIDKRRIGESIKSLRRKKRLTQADLAERTGYSVRTLRRIEKEGTDNLSIILVFAEALKVSPLDILKGCFLFIRKKALAGFPVQRLLPSVIHARSRQAEPIGATHKLLEWAFAATTEGTRLSFNFQ